ncbi:hypothetical protein BpHYR1_020105 [Brachionus plicatilis]|uniref:RNA-directed DNA polymerase from mobile element jockey-like n=1 Tax=Brachionus plicatilis TaxID=10195 RepID=A0A3M7QP51_BRAPC|nr:hypothetical protein BpHYR1_020105 [Brachionus plicatilis]
MACRITENSKLNDIVVGQWMKTKLSYQPLPDQCFNFNQSESKHWQALLSINMENNSNKKFINLKNDNHSTSDPVEIAEFFILNMLKTTNSRAAAGLDLISNKIFNSSLNHGHIPPIWKKSKIIIILKKINLHIV